MKQKSILKSNGCYICGNPNTEEHHVFFGGNRKVSDENGFTVRLCAEHHRGLYGVHGKYGYMLDGYLKRICQREYEKSHSREDFMKLIGRNYLNE